MSQAAAATGDSQKTAPVYIFCEGEAVLDAPVKTAWPCLIDYPSWQNYTRIESISGEPGQEGEVVLLDKDDGEGEDPSSPYYARTIKLEPEQRIVWKTFPYDEETEDYFGIVDFRVEEVDGKTHYSYALTYEFVVPYEGEEKLAAFQDHEQVAFDQYTSHVLPDLEKQIAAAVEGGV